MKKIELRYRGEELLPLVVNSSDEVSEYEAFIESFNALAAKHPYFREKIKNKHYPVFQYLDPDFQQMTELTGNANILPSHRFWVKMCPLNSPLKTMQSAKMNDQEAQGISSAVPLDPILEAAGPDEVIELRQEEANKLSNPSLGKTRKTKASHSSHRYTIQTFPTPTLSSNVKEILDKGLFKLRTNQFVKEVTPFLWSLVEGKPNLETCETYAASLALKFESIATADTSPYNVTDLLGELIFTYTKNNYVPRVVEDSERQRGSIQALIEQRDLKRAAESAGVKTKKAKKTLEEPKSFEEQLTLLKSKSKDLEPVIKSLDKFKKERKSKMCGFEKICDVIKEWPVFKNPEMISAEFIMQEGLNLSTLENDFNHMVEIMSNMFEVDKSTELQKIVIMQEVEKAVSLPLSTKCLNAINLVEITNPMKVPKMPHRNHSDGPVVIIYVNKDEATNAVVHTENKTISVLDKPSAFGLFSLLVGTYYTFNRHYPECYKNFFDVLETLVLHNEARNDSKKFADFLIRFKEASKQI